MEGYLSEDKIFEEEQEQENYSKNYINDQALIRESVPLLKPLCMANKFDFILLDGSDFTRHSEFEIVDTICKPKYLALDGLETLSSVDKISEQLTSHWEQMANGQDGDRRWGIYRRRV